MDHQSAARVIDGMVDSLRNEPCQFSIELKVVGHQVSVTNGGIGQIISATGGGYKTKTIANRVSVDGSSVQLARGAGDQAMEEQVAALIKALEQISDQFKSGNPDKGLIRNILGALGESWVPPMISAVVASLVALF
ncbi:hypothetical protein ACF8O8_21655 [Pseudomonas sp. TYF_14]|uniref:hypothetical protein n=1 Tax=Pseudomonas sp. TYF_14 TaxID=3367193 RepID=UPI00370CD2CC